MTPILLHRISHAEFEPHWRLQAHSHENFHEIYLVTRGQAAATVEDKVVYGRVGDVLYHPRGTVHFPSAIGEDRLEFHHLRWTGGDELVAQWSLDPVFDRSGHLTYLLEWLLDLAALTGESVEATCNGITHLVITEITRLHRQPQTEMVEKVSRYIRRRLREPLSLDQLAAAAHLSKYHFLRRFREESGVTPMRFLMNARVQAARDLIARSNLTLDDVAEQTGFADGAHMSQTFRRILGAPPSHWRRVRQR